MEIWSSNVYVSTDVQGALSLALKSVGGWRKDEFQWMSLALVDDRKDIRPQKTLQKLPFMKLRAFPPLLSPLCRHILLCEKVTVGWC